MTTLRPKIHAQNSAPHNRYFSAPITRTENLRRCINPTAMDAGRFRGDFRGAAATRSLAIGSRFTSPVVSGACTQRSVLPKSFGPRAASALVSQKLPPYLKLRAAEPVDVVRPDVADLA